MNREELQLAIQETLHKIHQIKKQIDEATDPQDEKMLKRKLKELQYLQFWHLDLLERQDK